MSRVTLAVMSCLLVAATGASAGTRGKRSHNRASAAIDEDDEAVVIDEDDEAYDDATEAEDEDEDSDDESDDEDATVEWTDEPDDVAVRPRTELYFRAGLARVVPHFQSSGMELEPQGIARLATPMGPVQGGVETSPMTAAVAIIGVAPAALKGHVAFETVIGVPRKTQLRAYGELADVSLAPTALDLVPTGVPPLGPELGEATAVPLMLTAVLRSPAMGPVRLYAGGGASVLFVTGAEITNAVLTEVATPKLEITPSLGVVAQAGVDLHLFGSVYLRADYKAMWFEPAETRITNIHVRTTIPLMETVHVGSARSQATAAPRMVQIGIGANF